jgi:hypothetical protein
VIALAVGHAVTVGVVLVVPPPPPPKFDPPPHPASPKLAIQKLATTLSQIADCFAVFNMTQLLL